MIYKAYIMVMVLMTSLSTWAQVGNAQEQMEIKGSVKGKENYVPISGVQVSTDKGQYTRTNGLGEFTIKASIGDMLIVEGPELETVRYRITSDEDVDVLVEGYGGSRSVQKREASSSRSALMDHQRFLDSANFYKKSDFEKSIDFIARSMEPLGSSGNKRELSSSLRTLGEIYMYHKQYDLAITNFKDALAAQESNRTKLLLGEAYVLNGNYERAISILEPLVETKNMVPYQRVELYETLGDAHKELSQLKESQDYYQEGLIIAEKNQISPKEIDLSSKIADAFAIEDRVIEAEGFYQNSLKLSKKVAPERLIQESEKVADFYNQKNRYNDEIQLRKKNLDELEQLPKSSVASAGQGISTRDTVTSQRINYKIANAYIAQDKLDEAIPYLEKSIVEADRDDDLVVQKDATRKLSEVYRNKGDYTKALESYQDYVAVVDSLYVRKEQEISRAARFNREIANTQNRISSLEQERELSQSKYSLAVTEQQLYEETSKRQKWIIYSLIFGIALMALTAFLYYRSNKQQKLANNLLALKSLRTQMNPHFIFNALNSVNNYIAKSDERSANRFLSEFSVLMRSVLENSEEDFIPLAKELELLELYVKLEHSRFSDKFDYEIDVESQIDVDAFQIPPMLLQPYIENAIWHGLRYKDEKGFLKIKVRQVMDDMLEICIEDNGIGRKKSAELKTTNQRKQKSKGMGNIQKRIQILNDMYKNRVEVSIADLNEDRTGTKVSLKLKKTMMELKAVIVEDEANSREILRNYLTKYCENISLLGEGATIEEGLKEIKKHQPDLVFLDVEMPFGNAFDLLDKIPDRTFETIFVTAYNQYAMDALNHHAAYYLMKPINIDELIKAVDYVRAIKEKENALEGQVLQARHVGAEGKITLPQQDGFQVLDVSNIYFCKADDNYTEIYLEKKKIVVSKTLKYFEEALQSYSFARIHKSYLVNVAEVVKYKKGKGGSVVLSNGKELSVSASKKADLLSYFK